MSEFTPLREAVDTLASRSPSPDFGDLKRRATRRRRRRVVMVAAAAAAVIAVGGGLAVGTLGGSDQPSLIGEPTTPSPEPPTVAPDRPSPDEQGLEAATARYQALRTALTLVPGWAISDATQAQSYLTVLDRCERTWLDDDLLRGGVGSGNNIGPYIPSDGLPIRWGENNFGFPGDAPLVMDRLIADLEACDAESWGTRPIGQTGAVLAFSDTGVVWIQHKNAHVSVLHVLTTDGPPPLAVQVEVADQVYSWMQ